VSKWLALLTRRGARSLDVIGAPSPEGLLCVLVLAPSAFPRNRFPTLFVRADAKRVRARAAQLRTIIRHLAGKARAKVELSTFVQEGDKEMAIVGYRIRDLKLERKAWLDRLELALVRVAIDRIGSVDDPALRRRMAELGALDDPRLAVTDGDRRTIERALAAWGTCVTRTA
jgi:hypothetical protein